VGFEVSPFFVWRCLAKHKTTTEAIVTRSAAIASAMYHVGASTAGDDSGEQVINNSPNTCGASLQDKAKGKLAMKTGSHWKRNARPVAAQKRRKTVSWGKRPTLEEDPDETWQDVPASVSEDTNKGRSEASLFVFIVIYVRFMLNVLKVPRMESKMESPKKNSKRMSRI
jgi:hypothetical protein